MDYIEQIYNQIIDKQKYNDLSTSLLVIRTSVHYGMKIQSIDSLPELNTSIIEEAFDGLRRLCRTRDLLETFLLFGFVKVSIKHPGDPDIINCHIREAESLECPKFALVYRENNVLNIVLPKQKYWEAMYFDWLWQFCPLCNSGRNDPMPWESRKSCKCTGVPERYIPRSYYSLLDHDGWS